MCWNVEPFAASAISAVNQYYGNREIPIGIRKGKGEYIDWQHGKVLSENFPHAFIREEAEETTKLYRKLLSQSDDNEITIVTVGPLSNILRLIDSKPDEYSPLSGRELIEEKVKEFVIMGGEYPEGKREWNFDGNMPGVTKYVLENLNTPITFLGYEIGENMKTGEVFNDLDKNSPLYVGFSHFSEFCPWLNYQYEGKIYDNSTYDQTAVLYAIKGGIGEYWERVNGTCLPDSVGGNTWVNSPASKQSYLKLLVSEKEMEPVIEKYMLGDF